MSDLPKHLQDLNPAQLEAVKHQDGPLLIFAGAGSGKTRVLTRRVANLVLTCGVHPARILAVTFTNKAAREMKHRVMQSFGSDFSSAWVSTFHSSCARILRSHAEALEYSQNFVIYDSQDANAALKRVYKKLKVDPNIIDPKSVMHRIDRAKNAYHFPDQIRNDRFMPEQISTLIADLYESYQQELRDNNAMDFGDLLCNTVTLFKLEPRILELYQDKFSYLLIDEYQDTNKVQYMLVKMLADKHHNLCVVGDDDQSIYAFRGATIENILNFKKDFAEAKVVTLDTNYRSTKSILNAANCIIAKNKRRQEKKMKTSNPAGEPLVCYVGFDEIDEAEFIVREMVYLLKGRAKPSQLAIFYRTNAQSRAIEEALCEVGIAYEIFGGHRFYERKEIKDILAYFRLVLNPKDNDAFLRIVNTPTRGLGATSVGQLVAFAESKRAPLLEALRLGLNEKASFLQGAVARKFFAFVSLIEELQEDAERTEKVLADTTCSTVERVNAFPAFLKGIAEKTDYLKRLQAEETQEAESRIENIYELFRVASEFVSRNMHDMEMPRMGEFLDRVSLSSDADKENTKRSGEKNNEEKVSLMTLHLAKGLEFDYVFLVGMEEGLLPHVRSLESEKDLEEERRLCYVGITRARKQLYLTRALSRQSFGRGNWYSGEPSRFLRELPEDLLEMRKSQNTSQSTRYVG